ncbi:hypothetical protein BAUCODRAFT_33615 [Baudoinia panamericana UAMH 10762]|uniref:EDC4-like protein pdc1 beta-propeller domain-containing protein n=1 Tax=Baudoinia panamericana (strain UAMH 10762) TaxID=717646 RepID=M2MHZ6_BAUPA|nr:uncharacterized protein BAUCODRAFT_33615 [Baudoinia panamericana UAMH 10762]EMC96266.1 hypothetical protein BAUCODRAFT_33615 [Baudoinia panamericana UAMH 10762]
MSDLQELFARLKTQSSDAQSQSQPQQNTPTPSIWAAPPQQQQQSATLSSPLFSPPTLTSNPINVPNIISPAPPKSSPANPAPDQQRTNTLLNLLKFNNQPGAQSGPIANLQNVGGNIRTSSESFGGLAGGDSATASRPLSAQDLMASLQRKPSAPGVLPSPLAGPGAERSNYAPLPTSVSNQQDFLLNLLRKPNALKPSQIGDSESVLPSVEKPDPSVDRLAQSLAETSFQQPAASAVERETTPVRQFGTVASRENTPFDAPQPTKASMFSYVNPFDQLHSSSPLNRTPKPEAQAETKKIEILKHEREVSAMNGDSAGPAAKSRKLDNTAIGDSESHHHSVSEAVENVGEKVDKEVREALAHAEQPGQDATVKPTETAPTTTKGIQKQTALGDDEIESSWESAEDSANDRKGEHQQKVKVYNFPMKPFVSINITGQPEKATPIRADDFMVIAKLTKEFDQMDRSLVAASQSHIVYAQTATKKDNHGFRVIRQDTGNHKQVFRSSGERVFNVQVCTPLAESGSDVESVLATGVNGSVFWTSLAKSGADSFDDEDLESQGFIMPAVATAEENTSGSPVKTRAKCSSRHAEFFAMSRSKTIHIIAPDAVKEKVYTNAKTRVVDSEKFLNEHGLRINTGKAGKDFAFSEDDSVIVSLDKSGVVKFWDIRDLTKRALDISVDKREPVELRDPLWSLTAVASGTKADEKPSVSSVMLLDKERPHTKGIALRYMLVGFKQNHILQLWDLGLGKAVQELRLPHEKDSDGFCSINYHPKTGIIALGHPTRNSVYFVHLSAPKYNVPFTDQAAYIKMLARHDPNLPKPESTAIMSGLREFSFDKVGQLRSLEMLKTPVDNASEKGTVDETQFELYVVHSKGVFGTPIKKTDLGWDAQSKMIEPVDAVETGVITVTDLRLPSAKDTSVVSEAASAVETPSKKKEVKKQEVAKPVTPATKPGDAARTHTEAPAAVAHNGTHTAAELPAQSKQIPEAPTSTQPPVNPPIMTPESYAMAAQQAKPLPDQTDRTMPQHMPSSVDTAAVTPKLQNGALAPDVAAEVQAALTKQFTSLYQRLDADKRVSEAAGAAKQDAMLRLVSSTLTENVEQSLHRIINASIEEKVIPALTDNVTKLVDSKLAGLLPQHLTTSLQKELKAALPSALQHTLKDEVIHRNIATATSNQVAPKVQQQVSNLLQQSLPTMATQATQKMVAELETRTTQRLKQAEQEREQANAQIEQLSTLVRGLEQTIKSMADSQAAFQEQILRMQQARQEEEVKAEAKPTASTEKEVDPQKAAEEEEVQRITKLLVDNEFEQATIAWLQSTNQANLFDNLFVRVNPQYLHQVSPLVSLSVSAAVTATLDTNIHQRLEWLGTVLSYIDLRDEEIRDVAPQIMDVLGQRLQGSYMVVSEQSPSDPAVLKKIAALHRQVKEIGRRAGE